MSRNPSPRQLSMENDDVKKVIEIAEGILNDNKILDANYLYYIVKRELSLKRKHIMDILHFLFKNKIIHEGSRFTKESILENDIRQKIFILVKTLPGIHFSLLKKKVFEDVKGIVGSSGHLIWHLGMLIKFNLIKKIKVKNYSLFLPFKMDEEKATVAFFLRDQLYKKVIKLLLKHASFKKSDIYKHINEKREIVYYRLKVMEENGIIQPDESDDKKVILNREKKDLIQQIIAGEE